jgi:hypothetical protein
LAGSAPIAELQKTKTEEPAPSDLHETKHVAGEGTTSRNDKNRVADEYARKQRAGIVRALTESKGRVGGPDGAAVRLGMNKWRQDDLRVETTTVNVDSFDVFDIRVAW